MRRLGLSIGLDVGDAVSGAGRLAGAIGKIAEAKAKAEGEGRGGDAAKLARDMEKLRGFYSGGILSGHSEAIGGAVRDIDGRIAKARESGRDSEAGNLYFARERLKDSAAGMERDAGNMLRDPRFMRVMDKKAEGRALTQGEEKYFARLDSLNETLRRNTEALLEANRAGDTEELLRQTAQFGAGAADLRGAASQGDASPAGGGGCGARSCQWRLGRYPAP